MSDVSDDFHEHWTECIYPNFEAFNMLEYVAITKIMFMLIILLKKNHIFYGIYINILSSWFQVSLLIL